MRSLEALGLVSVTGRGHEALGFFPGKNQGCLYLGPKKLWIWTTKVHVHTYTTVFGCIICGTEIDVIRFARVFGLLSTAHIVKLFAPARSA